MGNLLTLLVGHDGIQIMNFHVARHVHANIAGLVMPIKSEVTK